MKKQIKEEDLMRFHRAYYQIREEKYDSRGRWIDHTEEIKTLIERMPPGVVSRWCTPDEIELEKVTKPCCTYDGCGGSDDGYGSTYTESEERVKYRVSKMTHNGRTNRMITLTRPTKLERDDVMRLLRDVRRSRK